jgi:hypothetical protein
VEHLVGPFGSAALHVLLVIVLIKFTVGRAIQKQVEVEVTMMEIEESKLDELEKEIEKLEDVPPLTDAVAPPDVSMEQEVAPSEDVGPSQDEGPDLNALNIMSDSSSPLIMKGLYQGRSSGGRASALSQFGGKWAEHTERSVVKALEWLKNNQQPDGSWAAQASGDEGMKMRIGITGLCLLAFLAHGETPGSEKYGTTVEKAIRYLVSKQGDDGRFLENDGPNVAYKVGTYGQAIATYAISESYGLTRIPSLKQVMEKAVNVILDGQQAGGGWFYRYEKGAEANSSVSGWQIQALKAAALAGSENPRLEESKKKYAEFIKKRQLPDTGKFYYIKTDNPGDRHVAVDFGITAVSTLCLELIGEGNSKEARAGISALDKATIDWQKAVPWTMSEWYYVTQAKFHKGGQTWELWNDKFAREYVKNQNEDGSWTSPSRQGADIPYGFEHFFGPAFSTAMSCLTLQVYYRFLPTYKAIDVPVEEKVKDEVSIEII